MTSFLSADDLPSAFSVEDGILQRQLEESIGRRYYEACDGVTQALLTSTPWVISLQSATLTLIINCQDISTNWRVLNNVATIASYLEPFSSHAKIRICPPADAGLPYEVRVDEISIYRDPL